MQTTLTQTTIASNVDLSHKLVHFSRKGFFAALVLAAFPMQAMAIAGRVEFAVGNAVATAPDGSERALTKGLEINAGDTIKTVDGRVQLKFLDGGYISLQPNTQFKVEDYNYAGKSDGTELSVFNLIKGGLRAITGSIGKANKQNYRMKTPVATIGIRGTEWLGTYDGAKLLVKVGSGAVYLNNAAGDLVIYAGQTAEVGGTDQKPQYSTDPVNVTANSRSTNTEVEDTTSNTDEKSAFVSGDVRDNESGINTVLLDEVITTPPELTAQDYFASATTEANLLALKNLNVEAKYSKQANITVADASSTVLGSGVATLGLYLNFNTYAARSSFDMLFKNPTGQIPNGSTIAATATGGVLQTTSSAGLVSGPTGLGNIYGLTQESFAFTMPNSGGGTTVITNGTFYSTASLGANINSANIGFNISVSAPSFSFDVGGNVVAPGVIVAPSVE